MKLRVGSAVERHNRTKSEHGVVTAVGKDRRPVSHQWNQRFANLEELPLSNHQGTCPVTRRAEASDGHLYVTSVTYDRDGAHSLFPAVALLSGLQSVLVLRVSLRQR